MGNRWDALSFRVPAPLCGIGVASYDIPTIRTIGRRANMGRTKVSSKDQVVMPKEAGQEFQVITKGGVIIRVPDKPIAEMRGFVRGMRTTGFREKKDRL